MEELESGEVAEICHEGSEKRSKVGKRRENIERVWMDGADLNTNTPEGIKFKYNCKYFSMQKYIFKYNILESTANTFSNTFHFQDVLLCR